MSDLTRTLVWSNVSTWIVLVAAIVFLTLGLIAYFAPATSSAIYGVPLGEGLNLAFVRAMGARNIGLSLLAIGLIWLDLRAGLTALLIFASIIAALDATIVAEASGLVKSLKHVGYAVLLAGLGLFFALRP